MLSNRDHRASVHVERSKQQADHLIASPKTDALLAHPAQLPLFSYIRLIFGCYPPFAQSRVPASQNPTDSSSDAFPMTLPGETAHGDVRLDTTETLQSINAEVIGLRIAFSPRRELRLTISPAPSQTRNIRGNVILQQQRSGAETS